MAMSRSGMILRRAFSTVAPRALRTIPSPKILSAAVSKMYISSYSARHFCTDATKNPLHQKIVTALKTQMKIAKIIALQKDILPVPADFPFTIKEFDYEHRSLKLTRDLDGERIDVRASIHPRLRNTSNTYDDRLFTESTADIAPRVSLTMDISTVNGKLWLRFGVDASSDDIRVTYFSVDEAASDSDSNSDSDSDSDSRLGDYEVKDGSDLQLGLNEFVETRGIEKKYAEFLFKYIVGNYSRRPLVVLEKLENYFNE